MIVVVLDNIRSVYNVGSIFRTSDALNVDHMYLCGITPTPLDKRGHKRKDFAKVALGAEDTVTWSYCATALEAVEELKLKGYKIIAVEQDAKSVDYKKVKIEQGENIAFIIGSEVDGVSKEVLDSVDVIAEIPMQGKKESLNVTIAFGIAVYRMLNI